jgi:hypothetical protein
MRIHFPIDLTVRSGIQFAFFQDDRFLLPIATKKGFVCVPPAVVSSHCRKKPTAASAMTTSGQVVLAGSAQYIGAKGASAVGAFGHVQPELPPTW